jgi:alpha-galactosidase
MAEADLRLLATPNDNYVMWESVAPDRSRAMVMVFQRERSVLDAQGRFQLRGLDEASDYRIEETGQVAGGDTLARVGICVPLMQDDYQAVTYHLLRV